MLVVTVITTTLDVGDVEGETDWLNELLATIAALEDTTLEDEATEGATLDADGEMIEDVLLDADVESIWLDELLAGAREAVEDPVDELIEEL